MAVKIIHAADLHLDSPFESLSAEKAALRRREQRELLTRIAEASNEYGADLLLLAGDLFDSTCAYAETYEAICDIFSKVSARVFIAPGNHDYFFRSSLYASDFLPKNVHVFSSRSLTSVTIPELNCRVWGGAFTSAHDGTPLSGFNTGDSDMCEIMVLHGDIAGSEGYNPVSLPDIASSGLDYLALGHIHSFSGIHTAGSTVYAYPGCPEGRGFDETGEKGIIRGTVDRRSADLDFVPVCKRQYRIINSDAAGIASLSDTLSLFPDDIVRVVITGESDGNIRDALPKDLDKLVFSLDIEDRTSPARDIWEGLNEDTLLGLFLRKMRLRYDEASDAEKPLIISSVKFGLAALENRENVF